MLVLLLIVEFNKFCFPKIGASEPKTNSTSYTVPHFAAIWQPQETKRELTVVAKENQEEPPRTSQSGNSAVFRMNEEFITEVPEKLRGRVTNKLFQAFITTESRIMGALFKLDELLLIP